jgi:hypothetical protein
MEKIYNTTTDCFDSAERSQTIQVVECAIIFMENGRMKATMKVFSKIRPKTIFGSHQGDHKVPYIVCMEMIIWCGFQENFDEVVLRLKKMGLILLDDEDLNDYLSTFGNYPKVYSEGEKQTVIQSAKKKGKNIEAFLDCARAGKVYIQLKQIENMANRFISFLQSSRSLVFFRGNKEIKRFKRTPDNEKRANQAFQSINFIWTILDEIKKDTNKERLSQMVELFKNHLQVKVVGDDDDPMIHHVYRYGLCIWMEWTKSEISKQCERLQSLCSMEKKAELKNQLEILSNTIIEGRDRPVSNRKTRRKGAKIPAGRNRLISFLLDCFDFEETVEYRLESDDIPLTQALDTISGMSCFPSNRHAFEIDGLSLFVKRDQRLLPIEVSKMLFTVSLSAPLLFQEFLKTDLKNGEEDFVPIIDEFLRQLKSTNRWPYLDVATAAALTKEIVKEKREALKRFENNG